MGIGIAFRELLVVVGLAVAGLTLAALAVFTPWYQDAGRAGGAIVTIVGPAGVADRP